MKRLIIYDILKFILFLLVGIGLVITGIILYTQHQEDGELCIIIIGVSTLIAGCSIFFDIFTSLKKIEKNVLKTLDKIEKSDNIYLSEQGEEKSGTKTRLF